MYGALSVKWESHLAEVRVDWLRTHAHLQHRRRSAMDAAAKTSTKIDLAALLSTSVVTDSGHSAALESTLKGDSTMLLYVRNGA